MTFVLLVGVQTRKYHFCEEISDLKPGKTTFQSTLKIAYFVICFFNTLPIYVKRKNGKSTSSMKYSSLPNMKRQQEKIWMKKRF